MIPTVVILGTVEWGEPAAVRKFVRGLPWDVKVLFGGPCWMRRVIEAEAAARELPCAQLPSNWASWRREVSRASYVKLFVAGNLPERVAAAVAVAIASRNIIASHEDVI